MSFPRHTHHVCLVSEQTLPNYLGSIVPEAFPKKVHLIVTGRMKERADILEKALRLRGYDVRQYPLAAPEPDAMMDALDTVYADTGTDVAINVTGGTKIMALAAVEWAGIQDERPFLFYVDTDRKKILQIGGKQEQYALNISLGVQSILYAGAGHTIIRHKNTPLKKEEREALKNLLAIFTKNTSALSMFNFCAAESKKQLLCADMPFSSSEDFSTALNIAENLGKLKVNSRKIQYTSEEARAWCNGGWLEEYIKKILYQMKCNNVIDDWGSNVEIDCRFKKQHKNDSWNELDGVFTAQNRLFVIECKSCDMQKNKKTGQLQSHAERAIYKLDSLKKTLGGTLSRGMIVCIHAPRPEDIQRCKDLRIELLHGPDVLRLEEKLKQWIQNASR